MAHHTHYLGLTVDPASLHTALVASGYGAFVQVDRARDLLVFERGDAAAWPLGLVDAVQRCMRWPEDRTAFECWWKVKAWRSPC